MLNKVKWTVSFSRFFVIWLVFVGNLQAKDETNQEIENYNYRVQINPQTKDALQKFVLTEDIYSHSNNSRLNDITIVDSLNNTLPFEITIPTEEQKKLSRSIAIYPLTEKRSLLESTDIVSFQYDQKDRLSKIQSNASTNQKDSGNLEKVIGYLLDFGEGKISTNSKLIFNISKALNTSFLRFDIDQSSDLKYWTSVSRGEVLAQLFEKRNGHDSITEHNKIELNRLHSRYIRLKLLDEEQGFLIESVIQEYSEANPIQPIWSKTKRVSYDEQEEGYIFELSEAISYSRIKVNLAKSPSFIRGKVYSRNNEKSPWIRREKINLFYIKVDEKNIIQNELSLNRLRAKQLMIKLDNDHNSSKPTELSIDLAWTPQELIFFANGNAPYELVVNGNGDNSNSTKDPKFIEQVKNQLSSTIPFAKLGEARLEKIIEKKEDKPLPWSQISLWGILILGVVILGLMAKSLLGKVP